MTGAGRKFWRVAGLLIFTASVTLAGQPPAPVANWVHYSVCPSDDLTLPDRQLLDSLTRDLNRIVRERGGRVETGAAERACISVEELTARLNQPVAGAPTSVVVDGPTFRTLSTTSSGLLAKNGIRPVNPRLFTRPLRVFETADAEVRGNNTPTVGVYLDRDVPITALETAVAALTGQPSVVAVPFNTIPELARCFERGRINPAETRVVRPTSRGRPSSSRTCRRPPAPSAPNINGWRGSPPRL